MSAAAIVYFTRERRRKDSVSNANEPPANNKTTTRGITLRVPPKSKSKRPSITRRKVLEWACLAIVVAFLCYLPYLIIWIGSL